MQPIVTFNSTTPNSTTPGETSESSFKEEIVACYLDGKLLSQQFAKNDLIRVADKRFEVLKSTEERLAQKNVSGTGSERIAMLAISILVMKTDLLVDKIKKRSMLELVLKVTFLASVAISLSSFSLLAGYALHTGVVFPHILPIIAISTLAVGVISVVWLACSKMNHKNTTQDALTLDQDYEAMWDHSIKHLYQ